MATTKNSETKDINMKRDTRNDDFDYADEEYVPPTKIAKPAQVFPICQNRKNQTYECVDEEHSMECFI